MSDEDGNEITTDLYAKVTMRVSDNPVTFRVNFTSIPPEAADFMKSVISQEKKS